jgi:hypothetical protein
VTVPYIASAEFAIVDHKDGTFGVRFKMDGLPDEQKALNMRDALQAAFTLYVEHVGGRMPGGWQDGKKPQ